MRVGWALPTRSSPGPRSDWNQVFVGAETAGASGKIAMAMDGNMFLTAILVATEHYENDPRHHRWDGGFLLFTNADGLKPALLVVLW
jgi:hypothetical protein